MQDQSYIDVRELPAGTTFVPEDVTAAEAEELAELHAIRGELCRAGLLLPAEAAV